MKKLLLPVISKIACLLASISIIGERENLSKLKCFIAAIACLAMPMVGSAAPVFPNPGINLGNTLESTWGYAPPTQALIDSIADVGFKTLRVPCAWDFNSSNGTIDAAYMQQVTDVVDWALARGMYVIINDHWDNGWFERNGFDYYDSNINSKLISLWTQVANNFKWYDSDRLAFACANEPDAPSQGQTDVLYQYYQNWIDAMRANGGGNAVRWLIVQGPNTNIDNTINWGMNLPYDSAGKLMLEVHNYDPFDFTLMDTDESYGTWKAFWGYNYHVSDQFTDRNVKAGDDESLIDNNLAKMKYFTDRGIPVLIGEYKAELKYNPELTGLYKDQNYRSCTHWDKYVQNKINSLGFSGTCWNTQDDLFDSTTGAVLDWNLLNAMLGNSELAPIAGLDGGGNVANGTYRIISRHSGKGMDAYNQLTDNGTQIQQWTYWGGAGQQWTVTDRGSSQYSIIGVQSGKAIEVSSWGTADGTKVQLWDYHGGTNQKYTFTATSDGYYRITPTHATGSCLDVNGVSTADGALVHLWSYGGVNNQQWAFQAP